MRTLCEETPWKLYIIQRTTTWQSRDTMHLIAAQYADPNLQMDLFVYVFILYVFETQFSYYKRED